MPSSPRRPRRFRLPVRSRTLIERELDDEFRFHLDMRVAELVAMGASPEEARREALLRFGDSTDAREYCRMMDERSVRAERRRNWLSELTQDLKWASRQVAKNPGFTLLAVITLGLGIGATTAIFSAVNRLLINPLPFPGGDRIVSLAQKLPNGGFSVSPSPESVRAWREGVTAFELVAAVGQQDMSFGDGADVRKLDVGMFEPTAARMVHLRPILGRSFAEDETIPGSAHVAMLGYGFWKRRFGGDRDVIGKTIRLDGEPYTIVGVAPADFALPSMFGPPESREVWIPITWGPDLPSVGAIARLRPGSTPEQAQGEMTRVLRELPETGDPKLEGLVTRPRDFLSQRTQDMFFVLLGAVGLVLLIGCSNVANLLLARAAGRHRELALRTALGAGRGRLIRQILTESVLLAAMGGVLGILVAWQGLRTIIALRPDNLSVLDRVHLDPLIASGALGLALLTGLLFGLAPAFFATNRHMGAALRTETRGGDGHGPSSRLRAALVVGEVALSVVLLVGAGLLIRTLRELESVDVGFPTAGVMSIRLARPRTEANVPVPPDQMDAIVNRIERLPGVRGATVTLGLPGRMGATLGELQIEGRELAQSEKVTVLGGNWVRPEYFRLIGLPLIAGRVFDEHDDRPEVIINTSMARRYWPRSTAVGKRLRIGQGGTWSTVIGVVGDVRLPGLRNSASTLQVYWPLDDGALGGSSILLRANERTPGLLTAVTREVSAVDPTLRVESVETMDASIARLFTGPRFSMTLLSLFALVAVVLATVGLYGVVAYSVTRRTREMGIRMALGARRGDVRRIVVGQGARLAAVGITLGLALALVTTRLLQSQLYGVRALDPTTFAGVALLLGAVALLASYVPAQRATQVDPMTAVRAE
jgi:predicted permease